MVVGSAVVVADTLVRHHIHQHDHHHSKKELEKDLGKVHSVLHAKS